MHHIGDEQDDTLCWTSARQVSMPSIIFAAVAILGVAVYYLFFSSASQSLGPVVARSETEEKLVALSFDDGPNEPFTGELANILHEYNVRATFFCVGQNVERSPESLKRLDRDGHCIGNHSYSHSLITQLFPDRALQGLTRTQDIITATIRKRPAFFRPPWFFRTPAMLSRVRKLGLTTVNGTFGSYVEVFHVSGKYMAERALKKTRPGAILVFHDGYNNKGAERTETVDAIRLLIPQLLKAGYKFVTIPELLSLPAYIG